MKTVAEAREEKNLQDAREDCQRGKEIKYTKQRIAHLAYEVEKEKQAAKECIDEGYISFAKNKLDRIQEMKAQIVELKGKL